MANVHDQYTDGESVAAGTAGSTAATKGLNPLATQVNNSVKKDTVTTKGDIYVRNATVVTRLAVGTNDQVLTADSAQAEGIKWADAAGGYEFVAQNNGTAVTSTTGSFVTLKTLAVPAGFTEIVVYAQFGHEMDMRSPANSTRWAVMKIQTDTPTAIVDNGTTLGPDRLNTISNWDPNSATDPFNTDPDDWQYFNTVAVRYVPTAGETTAGFNVQFQANQKAIGTAPRAGCGNTLILGKK